MKSGKHCPWCGYDDVRVLSPADQPPVMSAHGAGYVAECINCGARGPNGMANAVEAVKAWVSGPFHYREINERGMVAVDPTQLLLKGDPQVINAPQPMVEVEPPPYTTTVDKDGIYYHLPGEVAEALLQTTREIVSADDIGKAEGFKFSNVVSFTVSPCGLWTTERFEDAQESDPIQGEEASWTIPMEMQDRFFEMVKTEIQRLQQNHPLPEIAWETVYFITVDEDGFKLEEARDDNALAGEIAG